MEVGGVPDLANVPYRWILPNGEIKMYTLQKLMGVMNVLVNRVDALEKKNAGTDFETAAKTQQRLLWLEGRMGQPHSSRDETIFDTLERFERNLLRLHKDVHEGGSPPLPHLPTPAPPYPTSLPGQGGGGPGTLPLREALGHLLYPTVMMSKEESSSAFDWGNKGKQPDDDVEEDLYKIYMNRLEKHDEAARQHVRALAKARETNEMMQEKLEEAMEKADRTIAENKEIKERVNELAAALHDAQLALGDKKKKKEEKRKQREERRKKEREERANTPFHSALPGWPDDSSSDSSDNSSNGGPPDPPPFGEQLRSRKPKNGRPAITWGKPLSVDKWDGTEQGVDQFIAQLVFHFQHNLYQDCSETDKMLIALGHMTKTHKSLHWAKTALDEQRDSNRYANLNELLNAFVDRFGEKNGKQRAFARYQSAQQGNQAVAQYNTYFLEQMEKAHLREDATCVRHYREGLKSELQDLIFKMGKDRPKTLQEHMDIALQWEADLETQRVERAVERRIRPTHNFSHSHQVRAMPQSTEELEWFEDEPTNQLEDLALDEPSEPDLNAQYINAMRTGSKLPPLPVILQGKCLRCGQPNHATHKAQCKFKRDDSCTDCGKKGHWAAACITTAMKRQSTPLGFTKPKAPAKRLRSVTMEDVNQVEDDLNPLEEQEGDL